jgi:hypothetical protein
LKHAVAIRDVIHFNLQVAHAASVQKRGLITDIINTLLAPVIQIQRNVQAVFNQSQGLIERVFGQIAIVTANVTTDLLATAGRITALTTNFSQCATAETVNVTSLVNQTGMLLHQLY